MKIAFVFMHPFSESMGSVVRVRELALSLGRSGSEVFIITPYEHSFDLSRTVHVIAGADGVFRFLGLSRQIYMFSKYAYYSRVFPHLYSKLWSKLNKFLPGLVSRIAEFIAREKMDVIQVEQDAAVPIGLSLKKATGLPLIADIHNISSEELVAAGLLKRDNKEFLQMQTSIAEDFSQTDHLVVVSEEMRDYVVANYCLSNKHVSIVPPGGKPISDEAVLKNRRLPFKVVYAGLVADREHTDLFVQSMPLINRRFPSAQFFMTDKGEAITKTKKLAKDLGVKPSFYWYDDYDLVDSFLSSCHLGVLSSSNNLARQMGTPAKLFTYLSAGLPVVANDIGGWSRIIEDEKVGLLTEDSPKDFAMAIDRLLNDEHLRTEFSNNALTAIRKKYNWDKSIESLVRVYESFS